MVLQRLRSKSGKEIYLRYFGRPKERNDEAIGEDFEAGKNPIETPKVVPIDRKRRETVKPLEEVVASASEKPSTSFDDMLNYFRYKGVVGEEKTCLLQTLCIINNISYGVEGMSGSGKTFIVDKLMKDLMPQDQVYTMGLSSKLAILNDAERINNKRFIYIPEIQKAMRKRDEPIIEVIKNLTEGKDAERVVTKEQGKTITYRIKAGVTVVYTLAVENDFKKDNETSRRFVRLFTDTSKEHIKEVLDHKARERCMNERYHLPAQKLKEIESHLCDCINSDFTYEDPFAVYMNKHIPYTPKTVGFIDHYYGLLDACAKFHHRQRTKKSNSVFLTVEDHYLIHTLYHEELCNTLADLNQDCDYTELIERARQPVDWKQCWDDGARIIQSEFPDIYEEWKMAQVAGNGIKAYNPLGRDYETLAELNQERLLLPPPEGMPNTKVSDDVRPES